MLVTLRGTSASHDQSNLKDFVDFFSNIQKLKI